MATAKYHVLAGFISYVIFAVAYFVYFNFFRVRLNMLSLISDYKWITLGLFLALFGSTLSDFDLLYKYLNPWHHRSVITHSALIPTIAMMIYWYPTPLQYYAMLMICFFLGFASHLFLDYFPSVDIEKLLAQQKYERVGEEVTSSLLVGFTPFENLDERDLKRLSGTYNIHFPKRFLLGKKMTKVLPPNMTRLWLIVNGIIVLAFGILLFALFAPLL